MVQLREETKIQDVVQVLKEDGSIIDPKHDPALSPEQLKQLYYWMVLTRAVDDRFLKLQRQGRIGFTVTSLGEEAAHIGSAFVLEKEDWVVPQYREPGAALLRGYPLEKYAAQMFGNSGDLIKGRQMPTHYAYKPGKFLSNSSPVGTQIPHAVGIAWAGKIKKEKFVTLVYFGDGATSQGDFHVGLNFAGVFKIPVIFFCKNNQWAISVPFMKQTAAESIAIKAKAYGIPGIRVDGNDLLAVIDVTREAVKNARAGNGPTLIEAVTYRMGAHSTSDDPRLYADEATQAKWKAEDPLLRFQRYLEKKGIWSEAYEKEIQERVTGEISKAVEAVAKLPKPSIESMFEDVYSEMPAHLKEEQQALRNVQDETRHA